MKRRTFIKSLSIFTGVFAFGSKFEFTSAFPFVHRKRVVPQMVSTVTAHGSRTLRLPVSHAQKGDVLLAIVAAHNPDGTPMAIEAQNGWTMISGQELEQRKLGSWYMTTDHDLSNTECVFVVHDAERSVGQLSVSRGVEIDRHSVSASTTKAEGA